MLKQTKYQKQKEKELGIFLDNLCFKRVKGFEGKMLINFYRDGQKYYRIVDDNVTKDDIEKIIQNPNNHSVAKPSAN